MKIILTTATPDLASDLDFRFGRGAYLLTVDTETMKWEAHANPGLTTSSGAGIKAAQFIGDLGVKVVISGDFGPHAFKALQTAGISMYVYGDSMTPAQVIERFQKKNSLTKSVRQPGQNVMMVTMGGVNDHYCCQR
jgi:predicted Fe-Mo cluster-binding NifX family protein